ncbi:hypothetical protein EUGRSUZ_B01188 [Eucalyptus grandis]|uniref:Uncharacterized protein n=2 Tax=Eucalyptus grandis TaxID=71139 RepID=A0ACC3LPF6_EUCGR|nr:hypothetical protein EUGRSUZ_B01188 [Eucalyptus grandis]
MTSSPPLAGGQVPSPQPPPPPPPPHQSDADEDDENVKQLRECSALYLSLQDCLVNHNRNWKSCQKGMPEMGLSRNLRRRFGDASDDGDRAFCVV